MGGGGDSTQGERIWSSFGRQKVKLGLLLLLHILCDRLSRVGYTLGFFSTSHIGSSDSPWGRVETKMFVFSFSRKFNHES
jgi:hypothetical protein